MTEQNNTDDDLVSDDAENSTDDDDLVIVPDVDENEDDDLLSIAPPPLIPGPPGLPEDPPDPDSNLVISARQERVAQEVRNWSQTYRVSDDPYVVALVNGIENRGNLTAFATTNPLDLLPVPVAKSGGKLAVIARFLTVTRNVLVFAPVLLTWLAISRATEAFGRYTEELRDIQADVTEGSDAIQANFLEFWQTGGAGLSVPGFRPLDSFWRLTDVAQLDAIIIALVIALTFIAGLLESRAVSRRTAGEGVIERDRTAIAVTILEGLQGSKSIDTESLEETLAYALSDLAQAARDVNVAAERMETASVGVTALTPRISDLTDEVAKLSGQFSSEVQESIQKLTTAVATLGSSLEGDLQRFMTDVLAGLEDVAEKLKTTAVGVEYGTKQLRDDLDAIHQRLAGVVGQR